MSASTWIPVLAGGVGGGFLTNIWAEWRQSRANRRDDLHRFNADQLRASTEVLALASDAQRLQARRIGLTVRSQAPDASVLLPLSDRYTAAIEALATAAARFRLLFPAVQRDAMQNVVEHLDGLDEAITRSAGVAKALSDLTVSIELFSASCRKYLVRIEK